MQELLPRWRDRGDVNAACARVSVGMFDRVRSATPGRSSGPARSRRVRETRGPPPPTAGETPDGARSSSIVVPAMR